MRRLLKADLIVLASIFLPLGVCLVAQEGVNYDESKVPAYTLPDPLSMDGKPVTSPEVWKSSRRPQILAGPYDRVREVA